MDQIFLELYQNAVETNKNNIVTDQPIVFPQTSFRNALTAVTFYNTIYGSNNARNRWKCILLFPT